MKYQQRPETLSDLYDSKISRIEVKELWIKNQELSIKSTKVEE